MIPVENESRFLTSLFAELNAAGVRYAVLRNAETLPFSLNGSDIDMLVAHDDILVVQDILRKTACSNGGEAILAIKYPNFLQTEFLGKTDVGWWGCCIDLFDGYFIQAILPLVDSEIWKYQHRTAQDIITLDPDVGAYIGYAKELLQNGVKSVRYREGAMNAVALGKDDAIAERQCRELVNSALAGKDVGVRRFVFRWKLRMICSCPIESCSRLLRFSFARAARLFSPCGRMIAVMGTDGAGKTSLLGAILPVLRTMNHKATVVHHLKPDLLPPLARFRGVKPVPGHVCTTPHASRPSGFAGSLVRISYLLSDYILGYWLKVRIRLAKTPAAFWIFDRYAYDILIDPRRFRIRLPRGIIKFFLFFVPRPDLVLCLGGDPQKIYARKPETSLEEVTRQVKELKAFCEGNRRAVWIDTTTTIEQSRDAALSAILSAMSKRSEP